MIIKSKRIYTSDGLVDGFIKLEDGKIYKIFNEYDGMVDVDYGENRILPGLIDTHNHGAFGFSFDDLREGDLPKFMKSLASQGLTGIFATTDNFKMYPLISKAIENKYEGTRILGIHSEGPWGSRSGENSEGASYPEVDMDLARKMYDYSKGNLKVFDIAPEVSGGEEVIEYFLGKDVVVAAFHTNSDFEEMNRAFDRGISHMIHLYNVMKGIHHRNPGAVGAGILRDDVTCELICDGLHVSLPVIELTLRMKDNNKIIMISDNVMYAGLPRGKYKGMTDDIKNDRSIINITEDGFVLSKTGRLSGSSFPIIYGIKNLVEGLNRPLEEIVKLASINPAKKYKLKNKGEIKEGNDGDLIVIDDDFNVMNTYVQGECVFDRKKDKVIYNEEFLNSYKL